MDLKSYLRSEFPNCISEEHAAEIAALVKGLKDGERIYRDYLPPLFQAIRVGDKVIMMLDVWTRASGWMAKTDYYFKIDLKTGNIQKLDMNLDFDELNAEKIHELGLDR